MMHMMTICIKTLAMIKNVCSLFPPRLLFFYSQSVYVACRCVCTKNDMAITSEGSHAKLPVANSRDDYSQIKAQATSGVLPVVIRQRLTLATCISGVLPASVKQRLTLTI